MLDQTGTKEADTGAKAAKEYAVNETNKLKGQGCVDCLNKGNRYCFVKFVKKENATGNGSTTHGKGNVSEESYPTNLTGLPVSTGNGKCCYVDDVFSPGCDPIGIKEWEKDARFK